MGEAIFLGTLLPLIFMTILLKGENRLLMIFFIWGLLAFALSLFVNNFLVGNSFVTIKELSVSWAPIVEEFTKALPLLYFLFTSKDRRIPIVYYGIAAGVGFAIQENYIYILEHLGEDQSPIPFILSRCFTSCLIHGITTGMMGYGLMLVRKLKELVWPMLFGLYTLAVTIHALYNLYISTHYQYIGMIMPLLLYLLGYTVLKINDEPEKEIVLAKSEIPSGVEKAG